MISTTLCITVALALAPLVHARGRSGSGRGGGGGSSSSGSSGSCNDCITIGSWQVEKKWVIIAGGEFRNLQSTLII